MKSVLSLLAFAALAAASSAADYTFSGLLTATSPKFNRPVAGAPPTSLSGTGTAVNYAQLLFTVGTSGTYIFTSASVLTPAPTDDSFAVLYLGALNPTSPLKNALIADDDSGAGAQARFSYSLTAGTTYGYVTTTFSNGVTGTFSNLISGPGTVTTQAVPEPASFAALGLGAVALLRRRKRA